MRIRAHYRLSPLKILELPGMKFAQLGDRDDGMNILFPLSQAPAVFKIVKPRRKRTMSAAQVAKMKERLKPYQWKKQA